MHFWRAEEARGQEGEEIRPQEIGSRGRIRISQLRIGADAAAVEVVGLAADLFAGVGEHHAGALEVIPLAADLLPAGDHIAGGVEVVPLAGNLFPARDHVAGGVEVVPLAADLLPAG